MNAEHNESSKSMPRPNIPAGALVIIPLRNRVLFPSMIMPLMVRRPARLQAVEETVRQQLPIGFVTQRDPNIEVPEPKDLYEVGTAADVLRMFTLPDGHRQIFVQGRRRFEIGEFLETDPLLIARVTMVEEKIPQTKEFEARILHLRQEAARALSLFPEPMSELSSMIERIEDPLSVIDMIASTLHLASAEREELKELARLERIPEMAPEYSLMRTYFDWLVELPWSIVTPEEIDLPKAREILDTDHYGLEKVKKRIIEFLAVRKLMPQGKSPILCFVGPPGVGKTSLGQSIARAMNRKFVRQSLGGVHDEADIRGHGRT